MNTVKVVTIKAHRHGKTVRHVGEIYEADERLVPILIGLRKVQLADTAEPESESPKRNEYRRRDLKAEK